MTIAAFNTLIDVGAPVGAAPTKVVSIRVNTGNDISAHWAIFGKLVVTNPHATPENVGTQLLAGATKLGRNILD